jgi:ferric-dicitrate binding protein FerR (iron transport regulator)
MLTVTEKDFMQSRRFRRAVVMLAGITLLSTGPLVLAADSSPRVLGTVVAVGKASMQAALDRWVPVDEKTHPVVDGTALKTEEGNMSITMKDGASINMSKKTGVVVGGTTSNYLMRLQLGTIAFKVYEGIGLSVTTPNTTVVVQRVSSAAEGSRRTFKDEISGIITHDGKETQVICLRGKFGVVPANAETRVLTEGNTVAVGSPEVSGQTQYATTATVSVPDVPTTTAAVYESPNAFGSTTTLLKEVETGGQEVVSEKTP